MTALIDTLFGPYDVGRAVCSCGHPRSQHHTSYSSSGKCWSKLGTCECKKYDGPLPAEDDPSEDFNEEDFAI